MRYENYFISLHFILVADHNLFKFRGYLIENMSFSGKKYRRVRCDRVWELCSNGVSNETMCMFKSIVPILCITRIDEKRFMMSIEEGDKNLMYGFRLDEELCHEKLDGSKVKIKFSLEGDNILNQVITFSGGKLVYFRREFYENEAKMTIRTNTSDVTATIYYEAIR